MLTRHSTVRDVTVVFSLHLLVAALSPLLLNALNVVSRAIATKPGEAFDVLGDVTIYFQYANRMVAGAWPYRDFPVEYPLLFPPLAALPRVFASSFTGYTAVFVVVVLVFNALILWLLTRAVEPGDVKGALGWYTAFFVALLPSVLFRYDIVPAALAFAAAACMARR